MFKKAIAISALLIFTAVFVGGCASPTYQEHKGAAIGGGAGAVTGGALGGAIGSATGHTGAGIVIGALLGGLAGAAIGNYAYDQKRDYSQASSQYAYNYDQTRQNLVRIENTTATPAAVSPGQTVNLATTYTVLGQQNANVDVTETREIIHNGQSQGQPQVTVQRPGGTYESRIPLTLPSNADRGVYIVKTTIRSGGNSDTRESSFTVQ